MKTKEKEMTDASDKNAQKEAIHTASLYNFIKMQKRKKILAYEGQGIWEGDLDEMRTTR